MRAAALLISLGFAGTTTAIADTVDIRPGKYEVTAEMSFAGARTAPHKHEECITAADLKDFSKTLVDPELMQGCTVSNYKVAGKKLTFNLHCKEDELEMKGSVDMRFGSDSFTSRVSMNDSEGGVTTIAGTAKRIGDCKE